QPTPSSAGYNPASTTSLQSPPTTRRAGTVRSVGADPLPPFRLHGHMPRQVLLTRKAHAFAHHFNLLWVSRIIFNGIKRTFCVMRDGRCRLIEGPGSVVSVVGVEHCRFEPRSRVALPGHRPH